VHVRLQQYLPNHRPPAPNPTSWVLPKTDAQKIIWFDNAPDDVLTVPPSAGGVATVEFIPIRPGFPTIAFLPFLDGEPKPQPPDEVFAVFIPLKPGSGDETKPPKPSIMTASFSTVRVMPFDDLLARDFAALWSLVPEPRRAWHFVYEHILALYSLTFPVMRHHGGLDLGSKEVVDRNIGLILELCNESMAGSTVYMPVTRDLSTGKRRVLEMYGWLVEHKWPREPLPISVPGRWLLP
jgi:hypothetical protein